MVIRVPIGPGRELALEGPSLEPFRAELARRAEPPPARLAYAAAHVCMLDGYERAPHVSQRPETPETPEELARWIEAAERLIRESGRLGLANGFVAGAGADHLGPAPDRAALIEGVAHQARFIREQGGEVIVLPLAPLARARLDEDGFVEVYRAIVARAGGPLFLHWLGPDFAPELAGYFPGASLERICAAEPEAVRGVKLSLLDPGREIALRRALLPRGQIVLTGDDWSFADLLAGGDPGSAGLAPITGSTRIGARTVPLGDFSHALLGALDAVAAPAALALRYLALGDAPRYRELIAPCQELARHLFARPTQHYKAGLAFLAWLAGHQPNALLPARAERARDREHLLRAAELAARAGVLADLEGAARRLAEWLAASASEPRAAT
jgi:hypothetical protein